MGYEYKKPLIKAATTFFAILPQMRIIWDYTIVEKKYEINFT